MLVRDLKKKKTQFMKSLRFVRNQNQGKRRFICHHGQKNIRDHKQDAHAGGIYQERKNVLVAGIKEYNVVIHCKNSANEMQTSPNTELVVLVNNVNSQFHFDTELHVKFGIIF